MHYTSLAPGEIRLLTLFPSRYPKALLRCQLTSQPLEGAKYEALSYVWGITKSSEKVLVNEEEVTVTSNLRAALRRLRDSESTRTLWVDALCINQKDQVEKSAQVRMMGEIYRYAEVVRCWLSDEPAPGVMAFIRDMSEVSAKISPSPTQSEGSIAPLQGDEGRSETVLLRNEPRVDPVVLSCLLPEVMEFLKRDYFHRVWTVQEMALARKVVLICGQETADWGGFDQFFPEWLSCQAGSGDEKFLRAMILRVYFLPVSTSRVRRVLPSPGQSKASEISLFDTLIRYRGREATDPRDKIFGLLNVCSHPGFEADYSKTTTEIYQDVTKYIIKREGNLDVLSAVDECRGGNERQTWCLWFVEILKNRAFGVFGYDQASDKLPSWIADWGKSPKGEFYLFLDHVRALSYNACGKFNRAPILKFPGKGSKILELDGVFIDRIRACIRGQDTKKRDSRPVELIRAVWNFWMDCRKELADLGIIEPYDGEESAWTAFLRTMTADQATNAVCKLVLAGFSKATEDFIWKGKSTALLLKVALREIARTPGGTATEIENSQVEKFSMFAVNSSFCVTDSGFMGRVPLSARPGDTIVVFAGGKTPFVLRQNQSQFSYRLIGNCYIHGMMNGEAFESSAGDAKDLATFCIE